MKLSVIIATKDRGQEISVTLDSLINQTIGHVLFEIIIIDNGSSDENAEILNFYADKHHNFIRYFKEDRIGLSIARNRGIEESKYGLIVFIDDDALASPNWLEEIKKAFEFDTDLAAIGGKVLSQYSGQLPTWITPELLPYLSGFEKGEIVLPLVYNGYPRGVNMAFRKSWLDEIGHFNESFGRKGNSLMSYEEIELCYRIQKVGGKILYIPTAEVVHIIKIDRISKNWFKTRIYWQGRSEGLFEWIHFGKMKTFKKSIKFIHNFYFSQNEYKKMFYRGFIIASFLNILKWRLV